MTGKTLISPAEVRAQLLLRQEIALVDLREERVFAEGHPLFAAQLPLARIEIEAPLRLPRLDVPVVLYDDGDGLVGPAVERLRALGYVNLQRMPGGVAAWRAAGYELFQDVNSYNKAFGELVEARRHTPSWSADELAQAIARGDDLAVLDARRFEEYQTMSIPTGVSVPGAELVLRAPSLARDPQTTVVVNCAGRTRSLMGTQSLINAGLPNRVVALRNGTIGWTLAGQTLERGQSRQAPLPDRASIDEARVRARAVADRAGVRRLRPKELALLQGESTRTLYRFDVRAPEEYESGHLAGFRSAPGGQLVQETDVFAPVRGARLVLADALGARADMTASWLAQMAWEVYVLDTAEANGLRDFGAWETGPETPLPPRALEGRYGRPYEGTEHAAAAMQAYIDWELGLVEQLARDGTHGFFVI